MKVKTCEKKHMALYFVGLSAFYPAKGYHSQADVVTGSVHLVTPGGSNEN